MTKAAVNKYTSTALKNITKNDTLLQRKIIQDERQKSRGGSRGGSRGSSEPPPPPPPPPPPGW